MEAKEAFEIVLGMAYEHSVDGMTKEETEALVIAEDYMEYWRGKDETQIITAGDKKLKEYLERQEFFNDTKGN